MADMVNSEIVQNHDIPVILFEFTVHMPGDIGVHLSIILGSRLSRRLRTVYMFRLTETKKLDVPSARANVSGNNFIQVSSPYIMILPPSFACICASQES